MQTLPEAHVLFVGEHQALFVENAMRLPEFSGATCTKLSQADEARALLISGANVLAVFIANIRYDRARALEHFSLAA